MMSPRPSIELRPPSIKSFGMTSLLGKSIDVATSTMTDLPYGNTYGLPNTQKISQTKRSDSRSAAGVALLSQTTLRKTEAMQRAIRLLSTQYRVMYQVIVSGKQTRAARIVDMVTSDSKTVNNSFVSQLECFESPILSLFTIIVTIIYSASMIRVKNELKVIYSSTKTSN